MMLTERQSMMTTEALDRTIAPVDLDSAVAVDAGLSARRAGVAGAAIEVAFGAEAARLSELAGALLVGDLPPDPAPSPAFVAALQTQIVASLDSRPVRARWRLPAPRFSPLMELSVVAALALVIAVGAFLMGVGSLINGNPTAVPTTNAETQTATAAATPEARVTAPAVGTSIAARRAPAQSGWESRTGQPQPVASPPLSAPRTPPTPAAAAEPQPARPESTPPTGLLPPATSPRRA